MATSSDSLLLVFNEESIIKVSSSDVLILTYIESVPQISQIDHWFQNTEEQEFFATAENSIGHLGLVNSDIIRPKLSSAYSAVIISQLEVFLLQIAEVASGTSHSSSDTLLVKTDDTARLRLIATEQLLLRFDTIIRTYLNASDTAKVFFTEASDIKRAKASDDVLIKIAESSDLIISASDIIKVKTASTMGLTLQVQDDLIIGKIVEAKDQISIINVSDNVIVSLGENVVIGNKLVSTSDEIKIKFDEDSMSGVYKNSTDILLIKVEKDATDIGVIYTDCRPVRTRISGAFKS